MLWRRYRPSQPKVRSTIQRFGNTTNPFTFAGLRTVCSNHPKALTIRKIVSAIRNVGEDHLQATEPLPESAQDSQDQQHPVVVFNICRMDDNGQDQSERVDYDVPLATIDLLAGIEALRAADLGRLGGLTVDDRRAGRGVATFATTKLSRRESWIFCQVPSLRQLRKTP